ncbi:MAG: hypothetical protein A2Y66_01740 [Nitrospirae bacterium RBG_13_41_22]|nr:MAG: hypothetical protein A2Y66_01740 [Nitrospirae bacterium RBG_13_41_22]
MDKKIKYIHLVFENCDCLKLTPKMFRSLSVNGITESYWINCFQYENGELCYFLHCKDFYITINEKGLKAPFMKGETARDRLLMDNDITHVHIYFKDGSSKDITVPWRGAHYTNLKQKNEITFDCISITIK